MLVQEAAEAQERRVRASSQHHILTNRLPLYGAWTVEVDRDALIAQVRRGGQHWCNDTPRKAVRTLQKHAA